MDEHFKWHQTSIFDKIAYDAFIPTDAVAFSGAHFGVGVGTIYLDEVGCTGHEVQLILCPRSSSVVCRYAHSEDAGVRCQGWRNCVMMLHLIFAYL